MRIIVAGLISIVVVGVMPAQAASAAPKVSPTAISCCR